MWLTKSRTDAPCFASHFIFGWLNSFWYLCSFGYKDKSENCLVLCIDTFLNITKLINRLLSIMKKNSTDSAGIQQIKWSLNRRWHALFCNFTARWIASAKARSETVFDHRSNFCQPCNNRSMLLRPSWVTKLILQQLLKYVSIITIYDLTLTHIKILCQALVLISSLVQTNGNLP